MQAVSEDETTVYMVKLDLKPHVLLHYLTLFSPEPVWISAERGAEFLDHNIDILC